MGKKLTDVTVILDRSGSMASCRVEAENGLNHFIDEQKKQKGKCNFTLVQFDTEYDFVYKGVPIGDVGKFNLKPRGLTALLDAVGRTINEAKERISSLKTKPGLVVFVIITDGEENSSHEFKKEQVKKLIEDAQSDGWQFSFLGANQDAFAEARGMGIKLDAVTSYDTGKTDKAFAMVGSALAASRMAYMSNDANNIKMKYSDKDRKKVN